MARRLVGEPQRDSFVYRVGARMLPIAQNSAASADLTQRYRRPS
jgi:hypothetical protein